MELYDALNQIKTKFGNEVILEKDRFVSLLADFAPEKVKERRLIKTILDLKVAIKLYNIRNFSSEEQYNEILKITKMVEEESSLKETAFFPLIVLLCEFFDFHKEAYDNIYSTFELNNNNEISAVQHNKKAKTQPIESKEEQFERYLEAANKGDKLFQYKVGVCYYDGDLVEKDLISAFKWFQISANGGLDVAQYEVGNCYEYGNGVKQNFKEARKWYLSAASQGLDEAKEEMSDKVEVFFGAYDKFVFRGKRINYFHCDNDIDEDDDEDEDANREHIFIASSGGGLTLILPILFYLISIVGMIVGIVISNNILIISGVFAILVGIIGKLTSFKFFFIGALVSLLTSICGMIYAFI